MSRPQIIVNVSAALSRRGTSTATGTAFLVFAGATGPSDPTRCISEANALAANVPSGVAAWVGDCLAEGAPEVYVLRATAVDAAAVTEAEWDTALAKLTPEFGMGQVLIPGVSTSAAHTALITHAEESGRCVLLDGGASGAAASALVTAAAALASSDGAIRAGMFGPWVTVPATGGGTRDVPASVFAAALAARGDAATGHANNAPMADQGRKAGLVAKATGVTAAFSNDELDDLADAGVSVFAMRGSEAILTDWKSVSNDARFKQLNAGRMTMEIATGMNGLAYQFLGRQIDGRGYLFAELDGGLRGYLTSLWSKDALYGATADEAFDTDVASVNTPATIADGELHAAAELALTPHTDKVVIDVVISTIEGA